MVCPWDRHSTQENEPNPYLGRGTLGDWAGLLSFGGGGSLAVCVCVCVCARVQQQVEKLVINGERDNCDCS